MIQGVVFDLDGTMIDSEPLQSDAFATIIQEYGHIPIAYENGLFQPQGLRGYETWKILKEKYKIKEKISTLRTKRRKVYEKLLKEKVQVMPGLFDVLEFLHKKKIKIAVASSSPTYQIQFVLKKFSLKKYFHAIVGGEDVANGKPHPEPFLKAGQLLSTSPSQTLVVEDSKNGVIAGKRAGMVVAALLNPYSSKKDLSFADFLCSTLPDIMKKEIVL